MRRLVLIGSVSVVLVLGACSSDPGGGRSSSAASVASSVPVSTPVGTATPSTSSPTTSPTPSRTRTSAPAPSRTATTTPQTSAPAPPTVPTGGKVVVLNPGHNGGNGANAAYINRQVPAGYGQYKACDTTGTNTDAGYPEHAFNWDVALRVRALLQARGVQVVMARPNDIGVGPCVNERAAVGNRANVVANITIHADGAPSSGHGFHVNQASRRPDGATAATAAASVRLGTDIRNTLAASSGLTPSTYIGTNGLYYRSDFAALNLARKPATFLELGNMRNSGDAALQSSGAGRQRIAGAITAGILTFLAGR